MKKGVRDEISSFRSLYDDYDFLMSFSLSALSLLCSLSLLRILEHVRIQFCPPPFSFRSFSVGHDTVGGVRLSVGWGCTNLRKEREG